MQLPEEGQRTWLTCSVLALIGTHHLELIRRSADLCHKLSALSRGEGGLINMHTSPAILCVITTDITAEELTLQKLCST